jgi:hypothetical protein
LLGYQNYLAQARSWKAARKGVPLSFEREVQAQASQALSDTRDMAAATLRMTKHMMQAGALEGVFDSLVAGLQAGGPAQIKDLWNHVANDSSARQVLKDQGLTDDLFTSINETMSKVDGRLLLQGQNVAVELKVAGQDQPRSAVFSRPLAGPPRNLHELLIRGQFERMVEQFNQEDALPLDVVAGAPGDLGIPDVVLAGAVQSVQLLAQHKRKLEDTGLATYTGDDPATIALLVGLAVLALGTYLASTYCSKIAGDMEKDPTLCAIGTILFMLSFLVLGFGGLLGAVVAVVGVPIVGIVMLINLQARPKP